MTSILKNESIMAQKVESKRKISCIFYHENSIKCIFIGRQAGSLEPHSSPKFVKFCNFSCNFYHFYATYLFSVLFLKFRPHPQKNVSIVVHICVFRGQPRAYPGFFSGRGTKKL